MSAALKGAPKRVGIAGPGPADGNHALIFTVGTTQRRPLFAERANIDVLRNAFREVRQQRPFQIDAIVVLPEHLHCIWSLPAGDADFSTRWRLIKTWFSKHCDPGVRVAHVTNGNRSAPRIWQQRYWEHAIRDEGDYRRHVEYIHYNPVKHGYVTRAGDWTHSSFKRYVDAGVYPADWGASGVEFPDDVGGE